MSDSIRHLYVGREGTDGTFATMLRAILCTNFKFNPIISVESSQEYGGNLATDFNLARGTSHGTFSADLLLRIDQLGWFLACALGSPTSTLLAGSGASYVTTLNFTGTWANADTFTLTFGGYTSAAIVYSTTAATLRTNIETALAAMPSIATSGDSTGNVAVGLPSGTTTNTIVLTCRANLANANVGTFVAAVVNSTAGTLGANSSTTAGNGAYTHVFTAGASGKPTLSFIEDDGAGSVSSVGALSSGQKYTGARIGSFDLSYGTTGFVKVAVKGMCHLETNTTSTTVPTLPVQASYTSNPVPCQGLAVTHMGGVYRLSKSGKIAVVNNIGGLWTVNSAGTAPQTSATDTARITEGFIRVTYDMTGRYTGYAGSSYAAHIAGTTTTSLVFTATSTSVIGVGATTVPSATFSITNPGTETAERMPFAGPETDFHLTGRALVDTSLGTPSPLVVTLVNEEIRYVTLT